MVIPILALLACLLFFSLGTYINFITNDYIWAAEHGFFAVFSVYLLKKYIALARKIM